MSPPRRRKQQPPSPTTAQDDLFSIDTSAHTMHSLDAQQWPSHEAFPLNRGSAHVGSVVRADLAGSPEPLIVAGYSSIAELVDFLADWDGAGHTGKVRLLLGAEPYPTTRFRFASAAAAFTEEVRAYWEGRGISVRLSARVLQAIDLLDRGRLESRFIHGAATLHAKIYVGAGAATVGSSNFTDAGLRHQVEANARFERQVEPGRYDGLVAIAENLWAEGQPWDDELRELLHLLLQHVSWQEALARACAVLLEGEWARRYLEATPGVTASLWPSQQAGIAQALWIIETVGSALVADATGSGKTRMGAHLVRAVRDRLWSTGRARRDLAVVVCPPAVEETWKREANVSGVSILTVSHGLLSRRSVRGRRSEEEAVSQAQILAVDESHNFLNPGSRRTEQVRESRADHVLLFTATPINRGPSDLLQLVGFLGADNFEDETLDILRRLDRRGGRGLVLAAAEVERLRREIQHFTVRRTKSRLNELVDREPDAYRHPESGAVCRYPAHAAGTYPTGETAADEEVAGRIRRTAAEVVGIARLEEVVNVPAALRSEYTDARWLEFRLTSVRGLAMHQVLSAMRSSRAALVEHLAGTGAAEERFGLPSFKPVPTGNVVARLEALADRGPPTVQLDVPDLPAWLHDGTAWRDTCAAELDRYRQLLADAQELSSARERAKAGLLASLVDEHPRVLAFDHHPVTLAQLREVLVAQRPDVEVLVATGSTPAERRKVEDAFERTSQVRAIALCSDAMNEGLNLQGASAIVHLDLPTTLRVAEQRVGRVDRMDSPHEAIRALWPLDGEAFATRANELLAQRAAESEELLGANLQVPSLSARDGDELVDVQRTIAEAEAPAAETWDGIQDAFEPARGLVSGPDALVPSALYDALREHGRSRVMSAVEADTPWAFLAIAAGSGQGAPRWLFLDGPALAPVLGLDRIADHLRVRLAADPGSVPLDVASGRLDDVLAAASRAEHLLLPRRMQRALDQIGRIGRAYADAAYRRRDEATGGRWREIAALADTGHAGSRPDPYAVAEAWLDVVRPRLDRARRQRRHQRFLLLREIDPDLLDEPLDVEVVQAAFSTLAVMSPVDERVMACIVGVPGEGVVVTGEGRERRPGPGAGMGRGPSR